MATLIALFDLASQRGRSAQLDGTHDAPLGRGHRCAVLLSILSAVAAEDICHFPLRAIHGLPLRSTAARRVWSQR